MTQVRLNDKQFNRLITGKIYIKPDGKSRLNVGDILNIDSGCQLESPLFIAGSNLYSMGAFSYSHSKMPTDIRIGRYTSIAPQVRIFKPNHPMERFTLSAVSYDTTFAMFRNFYEETGSNFERVGIPHLKPITIGNDVWIGSHVALKPGIKIGDGAVIATGAVVTKDVKPYSVVGGYRQGISNGVLRKK